MSQRRMFSQQIVDSDAFLDMPQSSQLLYFHLAMRADDDGFIGNPKKILKMVSGNDDDMKILIVKRFLLTFESGVVVIKHWRIHNLIRLDRYHATKYTEEKKTLIIKENGAYTDNWQPVGNQLATESSLGKSSLGKEDKNAVEDDDVIKNFEEKGGIQTDYQYFGLEIFDKTGAPPEKKAECIRLAKKYPNLITPALSFCIDYPNPSLKWKMFLWKLHQLRKNDNVETDK